MTNLLFIFGQPSASFKEDKIKCGLKKCIQIVQFLKLDVQGVGWFFGILLTEILISHKKN